MDTDIKKERLQKKIVKLLESLSPEVREEAESIFKGERGIMPVNSSKITIVWIHPSGLGRIAELNVTPQGREEFKKINELCREQHELMREINS